MNEFRDLLKTVLENPSLEVLNQCSESLTSIKDQLDESTYLYYCSELERFKQYFKKDKDIFMIVKECAFNSFNKVMMDEASDLNVLKTILKKYRQNLDNDLYNFYIILKDDELK